jgi:hypothetical protein
MNNARKGAFAFDLQLLLVGWPSLKFASARYRFQRYWRPLAMATSVAVISGMAALGVVDRQSVPLFVASILTLSATCLLRWNERWQAVLSCYLLIAFAIVEVLVLSGTRYEFIQWLAVLAGAGFAQTAVRVSTSYRRTLRLQFEVLKKAQTPAAKSYSQPRRGRSALGRSKSNVAALLMS